MKKTVFTGLFILLVSLTSLSARAESTVGYFGFEPDIITNYIGPSSKKMGYVRVTVDLMLNKTSDIAIVEHSGRRWHDTSSGCRRFSVAPAHAGNGHPGRMV